MFSDKGPGSRKGVEDRKAVSLYGEMKDPDRGQEERMERYAF